jgi:hypothetical protein
MVPACVLYAAAMAFTQSCCVILPELLLPLVLLLLSDVSGQQSSVW